MCYSMRLTSVRLVPDVLFDAFKLCEIGSGCAILAARFYLSLVTKTQQPTQSDPVLGVGDQVDSHVGAAVQDDQG